MITWATSAKYNKQILERLFNMQLQRLQQNKNTGTGQGRFGSQDLEIFFKKSKKFSPDFLTISEERSYREYSTST